MKDYYKTLNIPVNASPVDIKKAYRVLAMRFHPDKNVGDKYAEAFFKELQEAYSVLSKPHERRVYTQKRFYNTVTAQKFEANATLTPVHFSEECKQLETYVRSLDFFRMDKPGLHAHIVKLLSPSAIHMLDRFGDMSINEKIIEAILNSAQPLPLIFAKDVANRLSGIQSKSAQSSERITAFMKRKKQEALWERYKLPILIIIIMFICVIIYELSQ
ncbi:DnaJ domain-containing protein [Pinibacter soli]|uniref:DnaJ domain-containing protein n=1 Tax=Pinibacter soli TaxID=3044211 RepID=A0ABT6RGV4_9BACT|nr:DnaJ domain-containing protein [Pinibacter soli]MDI3321804.1 DnaJ domain-containing protein [Pinibacter soli]